MAEQLPRWPTTEEILENSERGFIDDTFDAVPPYDLEDWEIRGERAPAPIGNRAPNDTYPDTSIEPTPNRRMVVRLGQVGDIAFTPIDVELWRVPARDLVWRRRTPVAASGHRC